MSEELINLFITVGKIIIDALGEAAKGNLSKSDN